MARVSCRSVSRAPRAPTPARSPLTRLVPSLVQVLLFALALLVAAASGLNAGMGRRAAVLGACSAALRPAARASAADGKDDKKFQSCLSLCVYGETKIAKGIAQVEVVSRSEAFAKCKKKCATNKDQLLLGQPKK